MRDVLSSMEECLLEAAYEKSESAGFEIIDIRPPCKCRKPVSVEKTNTPEAEIIDFPAKKQIYN